MSAYVLPRRISVGLFAPSAPRGGGPPVAEKAGFVTYRRPGSTWFKAATFKRLAGGYLPSESKDSEVQLRKIVTGAVQTFDNAPVEGFRIVGRLDNVYEYKTGEYISSPGDFILKDPRGFAVGIRCAEFAEMLASADV